MRPDNGLRFTASNSLESRPKSFWLWKSDEKTLKEEVDDYLLDEADEELMCILAKKYQ